MIPKSLLFFNMQRKAYQLKAGNRDNLQLVTEELAAPLADEVTIEIKAIGLNFADIFAILGLYSATPAGVFVPGLEYAGIVVQTGKNVSQFKVGDKIMGITRFGAYTTHLNINQGYILSLPATWNFETGAAYLVQVLTAYYGLLNLGDLQKGMTVLIHSAAGGVGILANRIAKKYDAFTIGTVGRASKLDFLKQEGYDASIVRDKDFEQQLKQKLGHRKLNLIMECIGGEIFKIGYNYLGEQGRAIVYGSAHYATPGSRPNYLKLLWKYIRRPKIDPQDMIASNKGILGFNLIYLYEQVDLMHQLLKKIENLNIEKPHVGHTFAFEDMDKALTLFQTGKTIGKVVVKV